MIHLHSQNYLCQATVCQFIKKLIKFTGKILIFNNCFSVFAHEYKMMLKCCPPSTYKKTYFQSYNYQTIIFSSYNIFMSRMEVYYQIFELNQVLAHLKLIDPSPWPQDITLLLNCRRNNSSFQFFSKKKTSRGTLTNLYFLRFSKDKELNSNIQVMILHNISRHWVQI